MHRISRAVFAAWLPLGLLAAVAAAKPDAQSAEPATNEAASSAIALDILKKADKATKAVNWVQYNVTWEGTGWAKDRSWYFQGQVISKKAAEGVPPVFRMTLIKGIAPGSEKEVSYTAGSNGTEFFLIDAQSKKVHRGSGPATLGKNGRITRAIAMQEFTHPTPFTDEITGDKALLLGTATVDGIECHHVYVMYKGGQAEAEWYFSKKDFLPRRVDRIVRDRQGEKATRIHTVTDLLVDPTLPDDTFTVALPEGYEETTVSAPDPRIPM